MTAFIIECKANHPSKQFVEIHNDVKQLLMNSVSWLIQSGSIPDNTIVLSQDIKLTRCLFHLFMGVLSDKLKTLIDKQKESDAKLMELTSSISKQCTTLLDSIDSVDDYSIDEQIRDAIELLESNGYVIIKQ